MDGIFEGGRRVGVPKVAPFSFNERPVLLSSFPDPNGGEGEGIEFAQDLAQERTLRVGGSLKALSIRFSSGSLP